MGHQLEVHTPGISTPTTDDYFTNTPNDANEYTDRTVRDDLPKYKLVDGFNSDSYIDWENVGPLFDQNSTDAFTRRNTMKVTTVRQDTLDGTQDPEAAAILLWG